MANTERMDISSPEYAALIREATADWVVSDFVFPAGRVRSYGPRKAAPTASTPTAAPAVRPNKFGAKCSRCGVWVLEGAGTLERKDGKWTVLHAPGECGLVTAEIRAAQPVVTSTVRTNRYAGRCINCHGTVEPETGVLENQNGRWVTWHREGECPVTVTDLGLPTGRYALRTEEGCKFYVVKGRDGGLAGLFAQASDELHMITSEAATRRISQAILLVGPEAAGRLYGQEIGCCWRCGRTLTDDASRAAGIGPVCERRLAELAE